MRHARRSVLTIAAVGLVSVVTALGGAVASAAPSGAVPAGGVKGDPQPELKPFKIGNKDSSAGSIALEPTTGSLVAAYDVPSGTTGKILVCELSRGKSSCSHTVDLSPLTGLGVDTGDAPHVLVPSESHVVVIQDTCCDSNTSGDTLFYSSSNGGQSFGGPVRIGNVATNAAELVGGDVVFIGSDFPQGIQVQSTPVASPGPPAAVATLSGDRGDVGIGNYQSGVLAAYDYDGATSYTTYVKYAKSGDNFNSSGSYHSVGTFGNEQLIGMSGNALLTLQGSGKNAMQVRFFNGTGFGAAHVVPGTAGCDLGCAVTIDQDPSGVTHFFSETSHSSPLYYLFEYSTSNGAHWSGPVDLGNAITSYSFSAALDSHGSGLVLGTGGSQSWGHPVLAAQSVSFTLKSSSIKKGKSTTGSGSGSPAGAGRTVQLQVERSGRWYTVATTHESGSGSFSFTIKGSSTGTFSYRAVASDLAGYLLYGYSPARALKVTS